MGPDLFRKYPQFLDSVPHERMADSNKYITSALGQK